MSDPCQARPWEPLLAGTQAAEALAVVEEIAAAVWRLAETGGSGLSRERRHFSLSGRTGWALLFAYLDRAQPERGYGDQALELLDGAVEAMSESFASHRLYGGFPGVGWAVEHLTGQLFDDEDDPGAAVAEALVARLADPWQEEFDLISGLSGLGLYAVERGERPGGSECRERVVAHLAQRAERCAAGLAWRTPPEELIPERLAAAPEGTFDCGVAHGVPGVVGVLSLARAAGAATGTLLDDAVGWLLAQRLPPGELARFPYSVTPGRAPGPSRLGWCYGDAGVAAVLLLAARAAGRPDWEREALETARHAARRGESNAGVVDAGLCHGALGLAHLFNRLGQAADEPALRAAAREWLSRGLALRRPGRGIAGFQSLDPEEGGGASSWVDDPSFLGGATGVALALLAAATPVEPRWDRLLLCS